MSISDRCKDVTKGEDGSYNYVQCQENALIIYAISLPQIMRAECVNVLWVVLGEKHATNSI